MTRAVSTHERLDSDEEIKGSSNRAFGLVMSAAFAIGGLVPLVRGHAPRWWCLGVAVAFLLAALVWPAVLAPLNRLWLAFGLLLHRIVSPVVMGLVFYGVVTPIGLLMRLAGKDLLRLRLDRPGPSYWIERQPPVRLPTPCRGSSNDPRRIR